jgi:hypothetical protein
MGAGTERALSVSSSAQHFIDYDGIAEHELQ